jgi:hypothetical protein
MGRYCVIHYYIMDKVFLVVWAVMFVLILFGIFTRRGRNLAIKLQFGGSVVEDLGTIDDQPALFGQQSVRLLRCQDSSLKDFYILEVRASAPLAVQFFFIKVDKEMIAKLNKLTLSS